MQETINHLQKFRKDLYNCFPKRRDAIMNLLDAISSYGHVSNSVVQLSKADSFERQYSSITDAIGDGLPHADFKEISRLVYNYTSSENETQAYRFITDCTPNPRPYAKRLKDRHITHCPNQAPGNKPICVGHQYSVLMMRPEIQAEQSKRWLIPVSAQRVNSDQKGNEVGMNQIIESIDNFDLQEKLCISIGDTLYSTEQCRITAKKQDKLVHIFRISGNRNLYVRPEPKLDNQSSKGRKKEFGSKMNLGNKSTHPPYDSYQELNFVTANGKKRVAKIKSWNDLLLRGSRHYNSSKDPMNLIQVELVDEDSKVIAKRPLWICVFGYERHKISPIDAYTNYKSRFDIEHFFRFGKQKLLLSAYQTPEIEHEELWWQLCLLAYSQLYLGKDDISNNPEPWERYLEEYKQNDKSMISPSQAQKGFADMLKIIGTPARPVIERGKESGRLFGNKQVLRESQDIIFKSQKTLKTPAQSILLDSEKGVHPSKPKRITVIITLVQKLLRKANITPTDFSNLLLNST